MLNLEATKCVEKDKKTTINLDPNNDAFMRPFTVVLKLGQMDNSFALAQYGGLLVPRKLLGSEFEELHLDKSKPMVPSGSISVPRNQFEVS